MVQGLPTLFPNEKGVCMTALLSVLRSGLKEKQFPGGKVCLCYVRQQIVPSPPRLWEMGSFVPVQPNDSLGLSRGLQAPAAPSSRASSLLS